ncbi:Putative AC transposase [Linum grandiflorum]
MESTLSTHDLSLFTKHTLRSTLKSCIYKYRRYAASDLTHHLPSKFTPESSSNLQKPQIDNQQERQSEIEAAIENGNDAGEAAAQLQNLNANGEAAVAPKPPNAPLSIDEEVIDRAKLKSLVWKHFKKIKVNNVWKAKCNYCGKLLEGDSSNGTSHLINRTSSCLRRKIHEGSQKVFGPNYLAEGKTNLLDSAFDASFSKKELAVAIIMHEYPLLMVDHLYFKQFVCSLQPLFSLSSRNNMKKEIFCVYESVRSKIQKVIDENRGRIAITADIWTASNQTKGYMAVTAHYIDNSWTLRSHMLRFIYVPAPHSSDRLAAVLVNCMLDWNIDTKVSTITLDNCSTNDAMIAKINGHKYPFLQEIARDILAVPVTSVASESAFSYGDRLLDPHRSRLHQSTVEALMCTRTWLQDNEGGSIDGVYNLEGCFSSMSETRMVQEEAQSEPAILEDNAPRNRAYNLDDID